MTLNHAFCPLCGAVITVDQAQPAMICSVCNRPFMTSKAIFADSPPTPAPFSKKQFSTTPLSDLRIEYGILQQYKGKNSYVILPDCIKEIGSNAFIAVRTLRIAVLPDSVTKIGAQAFSECRQLVKLRIPDTVKVIGKGAFSGCKSLTELTIPNAVEIVESDTFSGCTALKTIRFPASLRRIESRAFYGCTALTSVEVPSGARIAEDAFPLQTDITQLL